MQGIYKTKQNDGSLQSLFTDNIFFNSQNSPGCFSIMSFPTVLVEKDSDLVTPEEESGKRPSSEASPASSPPPSYSTPPTKWTRSSGFWRSFVAICIPLLLSALEGSITNTALPTISDALNLGTKFSWVATAFLLASTVFQPLYSQLGDMWGRKYPMMAAITIFAIGSAICAAAQSGAVLITGRIVQGLGTGGIDLFAEMILCDIVPLRKRGPYLAIKHAAFALGTTLGPLLGGVFAEHGWYWCFLINLPVCVISLVIMWFWLSVGGGASDVKGSLGENLKKVDYIGSGILTASVVMLLVALSTGGAPQPWNHPSVVVLIVFGILGLISFVIWERSRFCKHPVMPPHVFSNRTTNISFGLTTVHGFITYGFQFYLPLFFQAVKGSSPTESGIKVMPTTLIIVVLAAVGGPILSISGKYKPMHIAGFALVTLGLGLCTTLSHATSMGLWLTFQFITAAGLGIVIPTMLPAIQVKLPEDSTAASAGAWAFLRGTGSLFGVAIPGAVFNVRFASLLSSISSGAARDRLSHGQAYQRATASFIKKYGATPEAKAQIVAAFTKALESVWIVFAVLAALAFCATCLEKEYKMRKELNTAYGLKSAKHPRSQSGSTPVSSASSTLAGPTVQTGGLVHGDAEADEDQQGDCDVEKANVGRNNAA